MRKKSKAFTLVELMVVVAVLAVLATVSVIGYKSYIKRENINATITEAEQVREVLISQIVADSDSKIVLTLAHNEMTLTYENGVLQFSSSDPAQATDTLAEIEEFDTAIRAAFPSLSSLPGTLTYEGNDVYYHHLSIDKIKQLIENGTIVESENLVVPKAPYEANDVAINIYTLEYITYDEKGRGTGGYDQIQFNISVSSINLELENDPTGKTDNQRTDVANITYFINLGDDQPIEDINEIIKIGYVNNNYTSSQAENVVNISFSEPDSSGYGTIRLEAKNATVNGPLLIKFTVGNVGRILRLRVFEKGRQTIAVPKLVKKFEYKYEDNDYKKGIEQTVTPADCGIGDNLINEGIVGYKIVSDIKKLKNPGDIVRIEFGIINKDYCWADDFSSDTTKEISVSLSKLLIPTPTLNKKEIIYNGEIQTPKNISDWNVGDYSSYVSISKNNLFEDPGAAIGDLLSGDGKRPGSYFTEFSIKDDYAGYFGWKNNENSQTLMVSWEILKKTIRVPKITLNNPDFENGFDYDGHEKSLTITYPDGKEHYVKVTGTTKATNSGEYQVTLSIWNDSNDKDHCEVTGELFGFPTNRLPYAELYEWIDDNGKRSSAPIVFNWHINPITIPAPTLSQNEFTYDGQQHPQMSNLQWPEGSDNYSNFITMSDGKKDVGSYEIILSIKAGQDTKNIKWEGNTDIIKIPFTIKPQLISGITIPSSIGSIGNYKNSEYTLKLSNFGLEAYSDKLTLGGVYSATEVGTYEAIIVPKSNYCWADSTITGKSNWTISKAPLTIPTISNNNEDYDYANGGSVIKFNNFNDNYMSATVDEQASTTKFGVGTHNVVIKLTSNNYYWSGKTESVRTTTDSWTVNQATIAVPTQSGTLTYNGSSQSPSWNNYLSNYMSLGGTTSGTNAAKYTATFTISNNNVKFSNSNTANVDWIISVATIVVPTQSGTLTYNGSSQSPSWNNYSSDYMSINGTQEAIEPGTYNVTFTITDSNHKFGNGVSGATTWEIEKIKLAKPELTGYKSTGKKSGTAEFNDAYNNHKNEIDVTGDININSKGNKSVTFSLKDKAHYCWSDGTTDNVVSSYKVTTDTCVAKGTLITLSDGSKQKVENLKIGDMIKTFNHETGAFDSKPVAYIFENDILANVINLTFSNDYKLSVVNAHGIYCKELNKYVVINANNYDSYVGYHFYCEETNSFIELLKANISSEEVECYSILSAYDLNHIANGMLCVSDDIDGLINIFDYDENMKIIPENKQADLNKYGYATYDMFKDYCSEEEFDVFNGKYVAVSIGKGLTTYEELVDTCKRYFTK